MLARLSMVDLVNISWLESPLCEIPYPKRMGNGRCLLEKSGLSLGPFQVPRLIVSGRVSFVTPHHTRAPDNTVSFSNRTW